jgi:hypothetical protein
LRVNGGGVDDPEPTQVGIEAESKVLQQILTSFAALHVQLFGPDGTTTFAERIPPHGIRPRHIVRRDDELGRNPERFMRRDRVWTHLVELRVVLEGLVESLKRMLGHIPNETDPVQLLPSRKRVTAT